MLDLLPKVKRRVRRLACRMGILPQVAENRRSAFRLRTGDERIYHIHLRKTGGTSLNHIFLGVGAANSDVAYEELAHRPPHCCEWNGYRYVGWSRDLIEEGNYFYAFSHTPLWQLKLPPKTYTVTCFRDPVQRVLSHYWMLRNYIEDGVDHPVMATEGAWLGNCFDDFIDRIPASHLKAQLWMFSESFDIREGMERVRSVSHVMFTENFAVGLERLGEFLGFPLGYQHRRTSRKGEISPESVTRLREKLGDVYEFIDKIAESKRLLY